MLECSLLAEELHQRLFSSCAGECLFSGKEGPDTLHNGCEVGEIGAVSVRAHQRHIRCSALWIWKGVRRHKELFLWQSNRTWPCDSAILRFEMTMLKYERIVRRKAEDWEQARPYYQHPETGTKFSLGLEGSWYDLRCMEGEIRA